MEIVVVDHLHDRGIQNDVAREVHLAASVVPNHPEFSKQ